MTSRNTRSRPPDQPRKYVGPDSTQAGYILQSHGFHYRQCDGFIMASTSICHPEQGGRNLNLSIRDRDDGLSVKCFSHGCDSRHIRDVLEALGVGIRDYDPPYPSHKRSVEIPQPVAPEHDRYTDLAFPGASIIHDIASFRRLMPGGACNCTDRAGIIRMTPLYQAGCRFSCSQQCSLTEIINSITSAGHIVLRRYRYHRGQTPMYRIRWDHATFGYPAKEYRGPGSLDETVRLKVWPHPGHPETLVIVEGEKAAEAVSSATAHYAVATWPNGVEAVPYVDIRPADEYQNAILWPDNDDQGRAAMAHISSILNNDYVATIPNHGDDGSDAADVIPPTVVRTIRKYAPRERP